MKLSQVFLLYIVLLQSMVSIAQSNALNYYLPVESYDTTITTPEQFLGHQVGEWHVSHDNLVAYMRLLAEQSPRITIEEYTYSHEQRPLQLLTITSETNHQRIDTIQQAHYDLAFAKCQTDLATLPAVLYQGYSIHGDEASGSNAAMLTAYYLAASSSQFATDILENVVVLFDPCLNPDGLQRFANWVNSHRSTHLNPDPQSFEFREQWPTGRSNHYWFDLNRDWLLVSQPESRGRIDIYHKWYPNVLTDHHEMGKNSTFFFQPGIPERTNLLTPQRNQQLTEQISKYHAKNLDSIGSKYFSKQRYDDYYYGKGSTYPDALGCIGILFEQATVAGHLQETKDGTISFPFAIRNQVVTSFSTWEATMRMKDTLLQYKKHFYEQTLANANKTIYALSTPDTDVGAYCKKFLRQHNIDFESKDDAIFVSDAQPQYRLIKSMMEPTTVFPDSVFYDVSTWNLPMAFGMDVQAISLIDEYTPINRRPTVYAKPTADVKVAMLVSDAANGYVAGSIWHQFDIGWDQDLTIIDIQSGHNVDFDKYDVVLIPSALGRIPTHQQTAITDWLKAGGRLVGIGSAYQMAIENKWTKKLKVYDQRTKVEDSRERGIQTIGGAVLEAEFVGDNWLSDGLQDTVYTMRQGHRFVSGKKVNPLLRYTQTPVASGFVSQQNTQNAKGTLAAFDIKVGKGRAVFLMDNPCFRGYWIGGMPLFANAIYGEIR